MNVKNSVFNNTNENNSFSIIIPGHYQTEFAEETIDKLNKLLELKSLELHVAEVRKRGDKIKIGDYEYKLSDFDTQKYEIIEELKNVKYNDLEDLVYRMRLSYDEIMDILDLKYIPTKRMGYSIEPNIYNVDDLNKTLKNTLPDNVKIDITIDERKYKTDLKINQTLIFTIKSFFYTILGVTSTSITLSITGVGLIILPISAGIACALSLGNKILHKIIINKYNKYKKLYERDQNTIKSFDKLYRKSLQDNIIDKTEYDGLCNIFTRYVDKNESFL